MRKLKFTLEPNMSKTNEQGFTHSDRILVFSGTPDRIPGIEGLVLHIGDSSGSTKSCPLTDTRRSIREDIRSYGCCWFEWQKIDKDYEIEVELIHG